ncbi:MAG: CsbD family protein [Candidatus Binatia bacterium]
MIVISGNRVGEYCHSCTRLRPAEDAQRVAARARFLHNEMRDEEVLIMASGKTDEIKGRVKEAAGALTGDKKLKQEGKTDQTVGKIKQKVAKVIDKVKDVIQ